MHLFLEKSFGISDGRAKVLLSTATLVSRCCTHRQHALRDALSTWHIAISGNNQRRFYATGVRCHVAFWSKCGNANINCPAGDVHTVLSNTTASASICTKCHTETAGPFVYEHPVVKTEGCTIFAVFNDLERRNNSHCNELPSARILYLTSPFTRT